MQLNNYITRLEQLNACKNIKAKQELAMKNKLHYKPSGETQTGTVHSICYKKSELMLMRRATASV